jgi:hypothetical protein
MTSARLLSVVLGAGSAAAAASFACGDLGEPAFVGSDGEVTTNEVLSPVPSDASEEEASPGRVPLAGIVRDRDTDAVLPFALVAIEVGGLGQTNPAALGPDGAAIPTLQINPFYEYGTLTDDAGAFSLDVPEELVGVHVYKSDFFCGVPEAGAIFPAEAGVLVQPEPLSIAEGGSELAKPTVTGFTATPSIVAPGETITMSARVESADPTTDPLSQQVLAVEPVSNWAGVFAPPEPGTQDAGYPNGIYARLVPAPLAPGEYTFYLVAATRSCVVSEFATQTVLVTLTGEGGDEAGE